MPNHFQKISLYHTTENIQKDSEKEFHLLLTYFLISPMLFFPPFLPPSLPSLLSSDKCALCRTRWVEWMVLLFHIFILNPLSKSSAAGRTEGCIPSIVPSSSRCWLCVPGLDCSCFFLKSLCYFYIITYAV